MRTRTAERQLDSETNSGNVLTRRRFIGGLAAAGTLGVLQPLSRMVWATTGPASTPLRIVFFTDVHARIEWETPVALAKAASMINAYEPSLVIGGGDYITDGFQSGAEAVEHRWSAFLDFYNAIEADKYPAIGNHDLVAAIPEDGSPAADDPKAIYLSKMGLDQTYYSFDAAGYHFMMLDSVQVIGGEYKYRGYIDAEQQAWIMSDLSTVERDVPIVVTLHIPLLTAFYQATKGTTFAARPNRVTVNNREVLALFKKHNLLLVLQGHLHAKEMLRWRDTTFVTGGAICAKWWRGPWHGTGEGFNVLTLGLNQVDWQYVEYGWKSRRHSKK